MAFNRPPPTSVVSAQRYHRVINRMPESQSLFMVHSAFNSLNLSVLIQIGERVCTGTCIANTLLRMASTVMAVSAFPAAGTRNRFHIGPLGRRLCVRRRFWSDMLMSGI